MENNKPMTAEEQQQPQVELHPCDCGHNAPNQFVHSNDDGVTMCSKCMIEYKNDKIQQLQEKLHDMDVLAEMNAEACERATKIFRKDHPEFVSRNAIPDNTTAINYVCDLLEKQQPKGSELPEFLYLDEYNNVKIGYREDVDVTDEYNKWLSKLLAYEQWKAGVFAEWIDSIHPLTPHDVNSWRHMTGLKKSKTTTELYNCEEFKEYLEKRRKEEGK